MAWDENANVCIAHSGKCLAPAVDQAAIAKTQAWLGMTLQCMRRSASSAEERPEPQVAQPISKSELADTFSPASYETRMR